MGRLTLLGAGQPAAVSGGGSGYVGPGDLTPGAATWYGLRAYSSGRLTGTTKAIALSTPTFTNITDIFILPSGLLDYSAVTNWVNTNGTPYIQTWYDQSGSGANLQQGVAAAMPVLAISPPGLAGGLGAIQFTGSVPTSLTAAANIGVTTNPTCTLSAICNRTAATTGVRSGVAAGSGQNPRFGFENGVNQFFMYAGGALLDFGTTVNNTWYAVQAVYSGANSHVNVASVASPSGVDTANQDVGTVNFNLGLIVGVSGGGDALTGYITELGVWNGTVASGMGANQIATLGPPAGILTPALYTDSDTFFPPTVVGPGSEDAATTAWANAVLAVGTLSTTQRGRVDTLIKAYKAAGVWTLLDHEWLFAAENTAQAGIDIVALATHTQPLAAMVFTANRGYKEGGFGGYLATSFSPSTGTNFQQNAGSFGCYNLTNRISADGKSNMGSVNIASANYAFVRAYNPGLEHDLNSSNFNAPTVTSAMGNIIICRTNSTTIIPYKNNAALATGTTAAAVARSTANWFIFCHNADGSPSPVSADELASAFVGGTMTGTQALAKNAALNNYMTATGCAVY